MFYSIGHITRFRYSAPVRESVMEVRMQPRSEGPQSLRSFQITTTPRAQFYAYNDHLGNAVYHFNVLREHAELRIEALAVVEVRPVPLHEGAADTLEWQRFNSLNLTDDHYDFLEPSTFAHGSDALTAFLTKHDLVTPTADPLTELRRLSRVISEAFDYQIGITGVHSPIDHALQEGRGVCQDFSHIMIAAARAWGIPARYVSGYLYRRRSDKDRSSPDAGHAWMEAYLPSYGWLGFDPTNNILAGARHIRAAIGRDYADVPPTRGVFTGTAESELAVAVNVELTQAPVRHADFLHVAPPMKPQIDSAVSADRLFQQQQQQQQQ